jgi:hypothetical protein
MSVAMRCGVAAVVAVLAAAGTSADAQDKAGLVAMAQAREVGAPRRTAASPAPDLRLTDDAPPAVFLGRARSSINARRRNTVASDALERAETRLLGDRAAGLPTRPDADRAVLDVGVARRALAAGDRARAVGAIDDAIAALTTVAAAPAAVAQPLPPPPLPPTPFPSAPGPPPPRPHTFAMLPGHWQLDGATYVWVKGDDTLRPVEPHPFVQGHYAWRDRAWVWVPDHYE